MPEKKIKIAIIDLYNGEPNQGMRCIQDHIYEIDTLYEDVPIEYSIFDSRLKGDVPAMDHDIYISSGGPGSPFEDSGRKWETDYFNLIDKIWNHNQKSQDKKHVFFICHSFQMMARFFELGDVVQREKKSFGIVPFALTEDGDQDPVFSNLTDPFYGADFRGWQVIHQNKDKFDSLGAKVLSMELEPAAFYMEPAMMAIRISPEIIGTQFHPEADPPSMYYHFRQPERKIQVVEQYGEKAYYDMIAHLENPVQINHTKKTVLPGFFKNAIESLRINAHSLV
ncbi:MAG: GMP synthase [Ignavibacteria bacterium]|nr:GMP synthase [Ignavibacteria bacterium]